MKRFMAATVLALMAGNFVLADVANAQSRHHRDHDRRYEHRHDRHDRYDRRDRYDRHHHANRHDYRRAHAQGYRQGWRDRSSWRRGGYVSYGDWNRGRYVDYRHHRGLYAPPRGYEWRHVDGNYVLAAAATGFIAGLILGQ